MKFSEIQLHKALALPILLAVLLTMPALADEATEVGALLDAGKSAEALIKANNFLSRQPHDMQMRFLKGIILTSQNKSTEAISTFTELTKDFPDLPEPHNNLAVLYASSGQYDKARISLNLAIQTNPAYATAHENLGDIYAKLASQSYDKALQLDSSSTNAKLKLILVRTVIANIAGGINPPVVTATPAKTVTASPPPYLGNTLSTHTSDFRTGSNTKIGSTARCASTRTGQ